ncbi:murein hydrolase activator EnvC family protein [Agromyces sp. MMS24-JH15]|uniref:murein hydrolase activator EnvC family protein n=1 Tax=Agromyces sp. MMS24-JH15 TaxID=3243765 RepID=UPI00374A06FA
MSRRRCSPAGSAAARARRVPRARAGGRLLVLVVVVVAAMLAAPATGALALVLALACPEPARAVETGAREAGAREAGAREAGGSQTGAGEADWSWPVPVPIRVLAPYRAPATAYSAGHRGIDVAATPGSAVAAPAPGVVAFSGMVAGRPVVTIDHGDGVVSSMEPVAGLVEVGTRVAERAVIGTVAGGGHCDGACVHLGVRVDGAYVSPFRFLGGVPRSVLLPWRDVR